MASIAQAKHPQTRARAMPPQRVIECKTARQVVVIEIRAVDALSHETCQIVAGSIEQFGKYRRQQDSALALNYRRGRKAATAPDFRYNQLKLQTYLLFILSATTSSGLGPL
jgi:hypothetical protein